MRFRAALLHCRTETHTEQVEQQLKTLLGARLSAGREAAAAAQRRTDARQALDTAEREYSSAHAAAVRAGWTREELRKAGLEPPTKNPPGRPRRSPRSSSHTSPPSTPDSADKPADTPQPE